MSVVTMSKCTLNRDMSVVTLNTALLLLLFFPVSVCLPNQSCFEIYIFYILKQHYVIFEILLSGSPHSWETELSSTVVKSVMVTPGNTRVHLLTSKTPEH